MVPCCPCFIWVCARYWYWAKAGTELCCAIDFISAWFSSSLWYTMFGFVPCSLCSLKWAFLRSYIWTNRKHPSNVWKKWYTASFNTLFPERTYITFVVACSLRAQHSVQAGTIKPGRLEELISCFFCVFRVDKTFSKARSIWYVLFPMTFYNIDPCSMFSQSVNK